MALGHEERFHLHGNCTKVHIGDKPFRVFSMGPVKSGKSALQKLFLKVNPTKNRISSHEHAMTILRGDRVFLNNQWRRDMMKTVMWSELMKTEQRAGGDTNKFSRIVFDKLNGLMDEGGWGAKGEALEIPLDVVLLHMPEKGGDVAVEPVKDAQDFQDSVRGRATKYTQDKSLDLSSGEKKEFFERAKRGGLQFFKVKLPDPVGQKEALTAHRLVMKALRGKS